MIRGGKFLLIGGCLAATGCSADHAIQVRAIADPNGKVQYSGGLLGEARGQLAIGAVGSALETFRTLQRQQPGNSDVYAGIAACYAAMGRFDLTRTNYELALAYAPEDPALLQGLASALDRLGETEQAAQVRNEIRLAANRPVQAQPAQAPVTSLGVPRATAMTVKVPEAKAAATKTSDDDPRIAPPRLGNAAVDVAAARLSRMAKPALVARAEIAMPEPDVSPAVLALAQEPAPTRLPLPAATVTMHATPQQQIATATLEAQTPYLVAEEKKFEVAPARVAEALPSTPTSPVPSAEVAMDSTPAREGPYLERTNLREVALITMTPPVQQRRLKERSPDLPRFAAIVRPPEAAQKPHSPERKEPQEPQVALVAVPPPPRPEPRPLLAAAEVQWTPLRFAPARQPIQLLNAARTDGLAARTRVALADRGWQRVSIGNARKIRQHSLVLYAPGRWRVAARLASQLRCKAVRMTSGKNVIVLLGRDAALKRPLVSRA